MEFSRQINAGKVRAEKATVRILGLKNKRRVLAPVAQGVLVPGGYILTAAHCINWKGTGSMTLGDRYIETIQTSDGTRHKVTPYGQVAERDLVGLSLQSRRGKSSMIS